MRFLILAIAVSVWAATPTTVTMIEKAWMMVEPDAMQVHVSFEEQSYKEASLRAHFNQVVRVLKLHNRKDGLECRGGSYHIAPRYSWKDQRQTFLGYHGNVAFQCTFTDVASFTTLSNALDHELKEYTQLKRHQGRIESIITEKLQEESHLNLELQLLKRAESKAQRFGEAMQKRCQIQAMDFTGGSYQPMPMKSRAIAESMDSIEAPIQSDQTLTTTATVQYRCE